MKIKNVLLIALSLVLTASLAIGGTVVAPASVEAQTPALVSRTYGADEICDKCKYDSHKHSYTYTSNGDGTHNGACACGEDAITNEDCVYGEDTVCRFHSDLFFVIASETVHAVYRQVFTLGQRESMLPCHVFFRCHLDSPFAFPTRYAKGTRFIPTAC